MRAHAATPAELSWLSERTGALLSPRAKGIAARRADGTCAGVVAYDGWTHNSCQAHMAVETALAWRALLPSCFSYPFLEAGRGVLLGLIREGNAPSCRLTRHLGFTEAGRVKDGAAVGEDLILFEMRRESCRYLQHKEA